MNRTTILLVGLIALALLIFFCVRSHGPSIQGDIVSRTSNQLSGTPTEWATVGADGRNVLLTGVAPTQQLREKAGDIAHSVAGVVSVDNQITVASTGPAVARSPYTTHFSRDASGIILTGNVPNEKTRNKLVLLAKENYGSERVIDELKVVPGEPDGWSQAATLALGSLTGFANGAVSLVDTKMSLSGEVVSAEAKAQLQQQTKRQLPNNYLVSYDLNVSQPIVVEKAPETTETEPVEEPTISCSEQFDVLLAGQQIYFPTDGSDIDETGLKVVKKVLEFTSTCRKSILEVSGHTDGRGNMAYNQKLSLNRAQSVVNTFVSKGVARERLEAKGYGESQPTSDNKTKKGQSLNRRIEFKYLREGN